MSLLRVLGSGVDGLELTGRGGVEGRVWESLEQAKQEAQEAGEPVPFEFGRIPRRFLVLPHGRRGWQFWLTSPDFELGLGRNRQGVPVYAQLHSAYLHSVGPELAAGLLGTLLQVEVMSGPFELIGSRVDVYADVQGWAFELADVERFASRGRFRRAYPVADEMSSGVFMAGRRVTSFRFGRDAVVARVYDKTAEIGRHGQSWLPELWGERDETMPVWRVEFQLRRPAIAEFRLTGFDEVLASVQDMWEHCTKEWLTLRERRANRQRARWPLDPSWAEVQAVAIAPGRTGVVRRRLAEGNEEMLVRQLQGYLTSWAAVGGHDELRPTLWALEPRVSGYLKDMDRTFPDEVRRKRARLLTVTGDDGGEPEARKGESKPKRRATSPRGRPEGPRVDQSTSAGRPPRTPRAWTRTGEGSISAGHVVGGERQGGLVLTPKGGGAVNPRAVQGRGAGRRRMLRRSRTAGEAQEPGEGVRAQDRGREGDDAGPVDGRGGAMAAVGVEPPTPPGGSEPNRLLEGGRVGSGRGARAGGRGRAKVRRDGGQQ